MSTTLQCDRCGAPLSVEESSRGVCPRCLIGVALSRPPTPSGDAEPASDPTRERPGARMGPFEILGFLGEGGMGVVYLAEQTEPIRRRVALKLIKLGMDTREVIARFAGERQALALMHHPHIASVHDAGVAPDGRPYFVMEYVPGVPVTTFCDQARLDLESRLTLFLQTCSAVQHAHEKGIIHRDIKPSNVLASRVNGIPSVTVIDFGVAKAIANPAEGINRFTREGVLVGTPEYMSPEQISSGGRDVDTRSDIHALGLLLYELLVGSLPFGGGPSGKAGLEEIRRRILTEEPTRPSSRLHVLPAQGEEAARNRGTDPRSLRRLLRGDLDWIVMKALEKDRARRYVSVHELARDVERHLRHEPVAAGPPGPGYRMRKFIRRNRIAVGFAASILVLLLVFALALARQARRISTERDRASREAEAARQVSDFLIGLFEVSNPGEARGNSVSAREILDRGAEKVEHELARQPEVQARMMGTMGVVYKKLGLFEKADPLLTTARDTRRELLGEAHPDTIQSMMELAELRYFQGRLPEAESTLREAWEKSRASVGDEDPLTLSALSDLGAVLHLQGKLDDAEGMYREALEGRRRVLGAAHPDTLETLNNMAGLLMARGKPKEAEPFCREALEGRTRALGPDHPETLDSLINLGTALQLAGDYAEAEVITRKALDLGRRIRPHHPSTLVSLNNVGRILLMQGKRQEAEPYFRESVEGLRRDLGDRHPDTLTAMGNLGNLYTALHRYEDAGPLLSAAVAAARQSLPEGHSVTGFALMQYGHFLTATGRFDEADGALREAESILLASVGEEHPFTRKTRECLEELGKARSGPEPAVPATSRGGG